MLLLATPELAPPPQQWLDTYFDVQGKQPRHPETTTRVLGPSISTATMKPPQALGQAVAEHPLCPCQPAKARPMDILYSHSGSLAHSGPCLTPQPSSQLFHRNIFRSATFSLVLSTSSPFLFLRKMTDDVLGYAAPFTLGAGSNGNLE